MDIYYIKEKNLLHKPLSLETMKSESKLISHSMNCVLSASKSTHSHLQKQVLLLLRWLEVPFYYYCIFTPSSIRDNVFLIYFYYCDQLGRESENILKKQLTLKLFYSKNCLLHSWLWGSAESFLFPSDLTGSIALLDCKSNFLKCRET